jgi:hypothetical protein
MFKTLIVFELIPEETKMALIDLTEDEFNFLSKGHGYIINAGDYDEEATLAVNCISTAFTDKEEYRQYCDTPEDLQWFGKFVDKLITTQDLTGVSKIISCGFYM